MDWFSRDRTLASLNAMVPCRVTSVLPVVPALSKGASLFLSYFLPHNSVTNWSCAFSNTAFRIAWLTLASSRSRERPKA